MSACDATRRVISLGLSCQVGHQIRQHLAGEKGPGQGFQIDPMYFDYIVTPFLTLLRLLLYPFPELPESGAVELYRGDPYWPQTALTLVHNFRDGVNGPIDIDAHYAASARKIAHLRQKFLALDQDTRALIFVVGNAQHDLPRFCEPGQLIENFGFSHARIHALSTALRHRYGARFRRLVVVENTTTDSGAWTLPGVARYNTTDLRGPEGAVWTGHAPSWHRLLTDTVAEKG